MCQAVHFALGGVLKFDFSATMSNRDKNGIMSIQTQLLRRLNSEGLHHSLCSLFVPNDCLSDWDQLSCV